jgi:hypothetical protein
MSFWLFQSLSLSLSLSHFFSFLPSLMLMHAKKNTWHPFPLTFFIKFIYCYLITADNNRWDGDNGRGPLKKLQIFFLFFLWAIGAFGCIPFLWVTWVTEWSELKQRHFPFIHALTLCYGHASHTYIHCFGLLWPFAMDMHHIHTYTHWTFTHHANRCKLAYTHSFPCNILTFDQLCLTLFTI